MLLGLTLILLILGFKFWFLISILDFLRGQLLSRFFKIFDLFFSDLWMIFRVDVVRLRHSVLCLSERRFMERRIARSGRRCLVRRIRPLYPLSGGTFALFLFLIYPIVILFQEVLDALHHVEVVFLRSLI